MSNKKRRLEKLEALQVQPLPEVMDFDHVSTEEAELFYEGLFDDLPLVAGNADEATHTYLGKYCQGRRYDH